MYQKILAIVLLAAALGACAAPTTAPQPTVETRPTMVLPTTAPAGAGSVPAPAGQVAPTPVPILNPGVTASGEIAARSSAELSFRVPGTVAEVLVEEGARVQAGQELARLDRAELARLLAAMADDVAMVVPFLEAYGDRLAAVVRRHLRDLGRHDLARDLDTVEGLVIDVVLLLRDHAGAWRPDGAALPWSWAWPAIRALVVDTVGHARADVELELLGDCSPAPVGAVAEVGLEELA
ncbi:MAG: biotin/lipoyl-binding protein, partial [Chloroflexaceae bacterium]|nr:biotin/lipoyl-binding protein [Chloroflexaceae bacterium]